MSQNGWSQGRGARARLVTLCWMLRPHVLLDSLFYVSFGWFIGGQNADVQFLWLCLGVLLIRGGMMIANDILDRRADAVASPARPLPSGRVRLGEARIFSAFVVVLGTALCYLSAASSGSGIETLVSIGSTALVAGVYSFVKGTGWPASLLISVQVSGPAITGWLAAGSGNRGLFLVGFGALTIFGFRQNLVAGLRDIEGDPLSGVRTTAARLGVERSANLALLLTLITAAVVCAMSISSGWWLGAVYSCVAIGVPLLFWRSVVDSFGGDTEGGRASRSRAITDTGRVFLPTAQLFPIAAAGIVGLALVGFQWFVFPPVEQMYVRSGVDVS